MGRITKPLQDQIIELPEGVTLPDASEYPVGQMVRLHPTAGGVLLTCTDFSGTREWVSQDDFVQLKDQGSISSSAAINVVYPIRETADEIVWVTLVLCVKVATTNDGSNYYDIDLLYDGNTIGGFDTSGYDPDEIVYVACAIGVKADAFSPDEVLGGSTNLPRIQFTKNGSPGTMTQYPMAVILQQIFQP